MKSYAQAIETVKAELKTMQQYLKVLQKYPPTSLYLLDKQYIVRIKRYRTYDALWRTKMVVEILASKQFLMNNHVTGKNIEQAVSLLLTKLIGPNSTTTMTPITIKSLPFYMSWEYKSDKLAQIIKTGRF